MCVHCHVVYEKDLLSLSLESINHHNVHTLPSKFMDRVMSTNTHIYTKHSSLLVGRLEGQEVEMQRRSPLLSPSTTSSTSLLPHMSATLEGGPCLPGGGGGGEYAPTTRSSSCRQSEQNSIGLPGYFVYTHSFRGNVCSPPPPPPPPT